MTRLSRRSRSTLALPPRSFSRTLTFRFLGVSRQAEEAGEREASPTPSPALDLKARSRPDSSRIIARPQKRRGVTGNENRTKRRLALAALATALAAAATVQVASGVAKTGAAHGVAHLRGRACDDFDGPARVRPARHRALISAPRAPAAGPSAASAESRRRTRLSSVQEGDRGPRVRDEEFVSRSRARASSNSRLTNTGGSASRRR